MEAFIASYLRDTFDLWLKNFDPKRDMSVRTMKGEATLNNMRMFSFFFFFETCGVLPTTTADPNRNERRGRA